MRLQGSTSILSSCAVDVPNANPALLTRMSIGLNSSGSWSRVLLTASRSCMSMVKQCTGRSCVVQYQSLLHRQAGHSQWAAIKSTRAVCHCTALLLGAECQLRHCMLLGFLNTWMCTAIFQRDSAGPSFKHSQTWSVCSAWQCRSQY